MNAPKAMRASAWLLMASGLLLACLPLLARLFPLERTEPVLVENETEESGEMAVQNSATYHYTVTTLYISPWVPAAGAVVMLTGIVLLRAARSDDRQAR